MGQQKTGVDERAVLGSKSCQRGVGKYGALPNDFLSERAIPRPSADRRQVDPVVERSVSSLS